ncbi:MAG: proline racemase family protein [Planctomycetales bacterium]|nr:proline racemase family protein [Planctomycetales bacterium]
MPDSFPVLDTHTGGEITRIVYAEDIGLDAVSPAQQLRQLRDRMDWVRKSLTSEPRGSEYAVGAIVRRPTELTKAGSIVFFNNVGYLGMCGHGLIGVVEALRYHRLIVPGTYEFETPAGNVSATLEPDHRVTFTGVRSYVFRQDVAVECDDGRQVVGEIAYGGNWFFITRDDAVGSASIDELMLKSQSIRNALDRDKIRGADDAVIDHVELYCPLNATGSRNFVLCPGGHYDRSPCGTGTSAKLACLAARGELEPNSNWIQQSITGSRFVGSYRHEQGGIRPTITGRAHVIAETMQIFDQDDALRFGMPGIQA